MQMGRKLLTDKGIGVFMAGTFGADMTQLFEERMFKLYNNSNFDMESSDYRDANDQFKYLEEKIKGNLPTELHIEFNRLIDACNDMKSINSMLFYRNGFSDGVKMILQSLIN
jgi:hypothetical protein